MMPGNFIDMIASQMEWSSTQGAAAAAAFKEKFGLNKDLFTQYVLYWEQLLRGDLGPSMAYFPSSVMDVILQGLPWTMGLLSIVTILAWAIGNILGAMVGITGDRKMNSVLISLSMCFNRIPYFILGLIFIYYFSYAVHLFPSSGAYSMFAIVGFNLNFIIDVIWHATLPALSIMIGTVGGWILTMRSQIVSILGSDYLAFAEAKGLKKNVILMRYAFRNAMLPQVTHLGMELGFIVSGAMMTEMIFAYPGIGMTFIESLKLRDINVMQGIFLFITLSVLTANLVIDIIYPLIDPRVRQTSE